jgi:hypothetical protein
MSLRDTCTSILYRALHEEEIGLRVEINQKDKPHFLNEFYAARKDMADPELDKLIILQPGPFPNELWIAKKSVELP